MVHTTTLLTQLSLGLLLIWLFTNCTSVPATSPIFTSDSDTEFTYDLGPAGAEVNQTITFVKTCEQCALENKWQEVEDLNAQKVSTNSEFSDFLIDLETTYGRTFDFTEAGYLTLRLLVPEGSYIRAMKLNFRDADGNFGGVGEVINNFPQHYGEWQTVTVDLKEILPTFKNWHGDKSPLTAVKELSLNPYNANQGGDQTYYVNLVQLSDEAPAGSITDPLLPRPAIPNQTYTYTFDDQEDMDALMAYRVFEASNQAFAKNIAGNPTNAIRMRGRPSLNNIAFLPIVSAMNQGQPVDFTQVDSLFFDYYLEPGGDDFNGSTLYLTSEHWNDILMDTTFYTDFTVGEWDRVAVAIDDLNLFSAKGEADILENIHEWRLNLNFEGDQKNITMWLDNVGWR